jgi:hypothetical protein
MEIKHTLSRFLYRVEAKPEGGFIARSSDPTLPVIEGATRTEVDQKIQASIEADLTNQFPGLKDIFQKHGISSTYHIESKPEGGFLVRSNDPTHQPIEVPSEEKIERLINSKFVSHLMDRLPPDVLQKFTTQLSTGVNVTVNRNVTLRTSPFHPANTTTPPRALKNSSEFPPDAPNTADGSPVIRYERGGSWFFRMLLALAAFAAILYIVLRHH